MAPPLKNEAFVCLQQALHYIILQMKKQSKVRQFWLDEIWAASYFSNPARTQPTCYQKLLSSTLAMGNPIRLHRKVMMTMATLTADNNPPWCHHNIPCTTKAFKPVQESTVSKVGTRSIDSQNNHLLNVLREIPTRISPSPPTADVIAHHANDNCTQYANHPSLPPLSNANNRSLQLPSPQPATDEPYNYKPKLDENEEALERLKRRWPLLFKNHHDLSNPARTDVHQPSTPSYCNIRSHQSFTWRQV